MNAFVWIYDQVSNMGSPLHYSGKLSTGFSHHLWVAKGKPVPVHVHVPICGDDTQRYATLSMLLFAKGSMEEIIKLGSDKSSSSLELVLKSAQIIL